METVKDGKKSVVILPETFSKISIQRKIQHQIWTIFFFIYAFHICKISEF